jgi:hypothetical protein
MVSPFAPTGETPHDEPVSNEKVQAWADEAVAGYDAAELRRRGRRVNDQGGERPD